MTAAVIPIPPIKMAEKALGLRTKEWKGNCYGIACLFVEKGLVPGVAVYGHWLGPVDKKSMFYRGEQHGFVQHGWVNLPDGNIFDPTRWVFEAKKPYLFYGENGGLYDEGGNAVRKALRGSRPVYRPTSKEFKVDETIMDAATWSFVEKYLDLRYGHGGQPRGVLTWDQLAWLANSPPADLAPFARPIFAALVALDQKALIPIDNFRMVERT